MVFHEYERISGHGFERAIQSEFSGDVQTGMMAIGKLTHEYIFWYVAKNAHGVKIIMIFYYSQVF